MYVTVTQFAEQRNISGRYVRRLIQDGKITSDSWKQGNRGYLIDPARADRDMKDNVMGWDPDEPTPDQKLTALTSDALEKIQDAGIEQLTRAEALRLQAYFKAELLKLEYGLKSGKLVYTDIVERKTFSHARQVRDAILSIPDRISPEIAATSTEKQVKEILTGALNEALADLDTMPDFSTGE